MSDDSKSRPPVRPFLASHDDQAISSPLSNPKPSQGDGDFAGIPVIANGAEHGPATIKHHEETDKATTEKVVEKQEAGEPTEAPKTGVSSLNVQVDSIAPPMPHYARKPVESEEDLHGAAVKGFTTSSTKKVRLGMLGGTIAVAAIAVGVYNLNQDIYSLTGPDEKQVNSQPTPRATKPATLAAISGRQKLQVEIDYLPKLSQGHYQLWLEQDGQTTSLGSFSINDDGEAVANNQEFSPEATFSRDPASLFITIEKEGQLATKPSSSIIATGSLTNRTAKLNFKAMDLRNLSGTYVLATPSDVGREDQRSGLWFATTDGKKLTGAGLKLPKAPAGWVYEGQIIHQNQIVAMGRFADPSKADSMTRFTPNPSKTPPLPGEDYLEGAPSRLGLDFPTNLANGEWKVLISLEPDNNGDDPSGDDTFAIHLLSASLGADLTPYKEYSLKSEEPELPKVTVTVK